MPLEGAFVALIVFSFVASATPGPNNMMVLASSVNFGVRRTIPHMLGVTGGFMVMTLAIGVGLGQIFVLFPALLVAMKLLCVAYLLWLAWKIARAGDLGEGERAARPMTFLEGALFQWVNPKAWMAAVTAVAAYVVFRDPWLNAALVALMFGLVALPSLVVWAAFGGALRRFLTDPMRLRTFNVAMALLLVASLWPLVAEFLP